VRLTLPTQEELATNHSAVRALWVIFAVLVWLIPVAFLFWLLDGAPR
jgi:hypothetical protein